MSLFGGDRLRQWTAEEEAFIRATQRKQKKKKRKGLGIIIQEFNN